MYSLVWFEVNGKFERACVTFHQLRRCKFSYFPIKNINIMCSLPKYSPYRYECRPLFFMPPFDLVMRKIHDKISSPLMLQMRVPFRAHRRRRKRDPVIQGCKCMQLR